MYEYVEREVELLHQPGLGQDVGEVGHQVHLPLAVDLLEHRRHRHVGQAVAECQTLEILIEFSKGPKRGPKKPPKRVSLEFFYELCGLNENPISEYHFFNPKPHQEKTINVKK